MTGIGARSTTEDGVLELVLNRPDERNPLDLATVRWLSETMLEHGNEVGAVLISGEGKSFSAGADLRELGSAAEGTAFELHQAGEAWSRLMAVSRELPVPVIVAAHGHALAGACGLAASADVVIAAEGTQFGMSEVRIGLFPIIVLPAVAAAIGPSRARELALTGRRVDAAEAHAMGLVHRVVPAGELQAVARDLAVDVASLGPTSIELGKRLLRAIESTPFEEATLLAQAMRGAFLGTDDFREGVEAFLAKRPPEFRRPM